MSPAQTRYWQDLQEGETLSTDRLTISKQDILEFAADFDPQPYHLDSDAADDSIFGGLCASGWQVTAMMMRLLTDAFTAADIDLLGSNGVSGLRWRKPVFAGDTLSSDITIATRSEPGSDPRFGYIDCEVNVKNQDDDSVIQLTTSLMIGTNQGVAANG